MADSDRNSGRWEGKEMFGLLLEMAGLMNTGLDTQTLALCVRLIEDGANPQALATVIKDLRREAAADKSEK
ncbi:Mitotic-spindle organizing protein 1 like protein [Argiope bruennichi]|uniref:Mitotic-spindle organizing protein 1 like protein n=1 Tax=Argiope bruennichi TaxID=94029 RepID=A0A8T0FZ26_ARGBR|nr:Mitotic-spindle organizing protein 1 like protein [Argiope bruennichi]